MNTEPIEGVYSIPIRRTRWSSFRIGAAAQLISLLPAGAVSSLLVLSSIITDGVVVIMVFGLVWGAVFFLSFPWQRRYARSLDLRRPGIRLANGVLAVPVTDDLTLQFKLHEPHELRFGWSETIVTNIGGPTTHARAFLTYASLSLERQKAEIVSRSAIDINDGRI